MAETDENGKIKTFIQASSFEPTKKTGKGAYAGFRTYTLENGKFYLIHEPWTKTYARRGLFKVENNKLIHISTIYGNGYYKGKPAPEMTIQFT